MVAVVVVVVLVVVVVVVMVVVGKYAIRTRLDPGTQATVVFPCTKSCATSTSQMPAVYFIPLYSLICLSIASTLSLIHI